VRLENPDLSTNNPQTPVEGDLHAQLTLKTFALFVLPVFD
jgi:hypothetical protein